MSPGSSMMEPGEPSHGDHLHPGPLPNNNHSKSPHLIHPLQKKLMVLKISATHYQLQVHCCCTHQTDNDSVDYIDNDSLYNDHNNVGTIFGEEVYNNID